MRIYWNRFLMWVQSILPVIEVIGDRPRRFLNAERLMVAETLNPVDNSLREGVTKVVPEGVAVVVVGPVRVTGTGPDATISTWDDRFHC